MDAPGPSSAVYTRSEVQWLKGLSHSDALYASQGWRDSLEQGDGGSNAEETLPVIARWWDVKNAMDSAVMEKRDREVVQLRTQGYPEEDIARITGLSRSTVRRRFEAAIGELLERLGGEYVEPPRVSVPSLCLNCGRGDRVYMAACYGELWACVGQRRRDDGKLSQAWQCRAQLRLCRPAIARTAAIGDVYELTLTAHGKVIGHRELPDAAFPSNHPWVKGWVRDTKAAEDGRPVPEREWRVPTELRDVQPARQSSLCVDCLLPRYRARIVHRGEQSRRPDRQ